MSSLRNLYIIHLTKKENSNTVIQAIKELGSVKVVQWRKEAFENDQYRFENKDTGT